METAMQPFHDRDHPNALRAAWAALFVGLLSAAVSLYWALGGTWLLDTIGGSLEEQGCWPFAGCPGQCGIVSYGCWRGWSRRC